MKSILLWIGLVSNYVLIINAVTTILGKITDAFTASVGNLNASEQDKKQYEVFQKIFFISVWIYGYASVGLITVFNPFIEAWIGREYQLGTLAVSAIVAEFFVKGVHNAAYTYRTTLGYFVQGKYSAVAAAIINIGLSVLLCKWIGLAGIFIATPISRIITREKFFRRIDRSGFKESVDTAMNDNAILCMAKKIKHAMVRPTHRGGVELCDVSECRYNHKGTCTL